MSYEDLLTEVGSLDFYELIDLYVEAKTKKPVTAIDVFTFDTIRIIDDLTERVKAELP
jgi:hypothetical protein